MNVKQVFMNTLKSHQLSRYPYDKESTQTLKNQIIYNNYPCGYQQLRTDEVSADDNISNATVIDPIQRNG